MKKLIALLFVLMMTLGTACAEDKTAPVMEVHQLELGYADGYYIRCGDIELMIDGGKPVAFSNNDDVLNFLRTLGAKELDAYIITHWHLDHCENFDRVLENFGTENTILYSPSEALPKKFDSGKRKMDVPPMPTGIYRRMQQGDVITLGDLTITCIGPENGGRYGLTNPDSLNFVLQYGDRRMLFTGDFAASNNICDVYPELCKNVDVFKFPHHGSKNTSGGYEVKAKAIHVISPEYVLMPSYLNSYPVYTWMNENGIEIPQENILTMREGHVVILTDGADYLEVRRQQNMADYAPRTN